MRGKNARAPVSPGVEPVEKPWVLPIITLLDGRFMALSLNNMRSSRLLFTQGDCSGLAQRLLLFPGEVHTHLIQETNPTRHL